MKNFMSIGNVTQTVRFDKHDLTLVLGHNMDLGGNGSRNGVGKTALVNAISYALYGTALTDIKKDNLINKTNGKNMLVSIEFDKNGVSYRIERGRKPAHFCFYVNDKISQTDEAQGENKLTQEEIDNILGMGHLMFKHILALNTYTTPFLAERAADQREIIEQLLGITELSQKADILRTKIKSTKDSIKEEEYHIKGIETANEQIKSRIEHTKKQQAVWVNNKKNKIEQYQAAIKELETLNVETELEAHQTVAKYKVDKAESDQLHKEARAIIDHYEQAETELAKLTTELEKLKQHECYACGHTLHDDEHSTLVEQKTTAFNDTDKFMKELQEALDITVKKISDINVSSSCPDTFYENIGDVYEHKNKISDLMTRLDSIVSQEDTYQEQIDSLEADGIKEISWDNINTLTRLLDHQETLLKFLTNKDSFIRKKIIDQNLTYINSRLQFYLHDLGLPHTVRFLPDLSVEIAELGRDLDFDNLSRGERNRLVLGMSWAFRDVFENMNESINLMIVDEMIDSGMDGAGVDAALGILKKFTRERNKNIMLISHRDELVSRVKNTLQVIKENGFTSFAGDETEY